MKKLITLFLISFLILEVSAQNNEKPKLVVGIVVDQMRDEYLYRFNNKYVPGGLMRLVNEGFVARNHHYHYSGTITGPGHAHVFTGSAPAISGIVGNDWYDKTANRRMYVAEDKEVQLVGPGQEKNGEMSPKNLKVSTITDQLKIATQHRAKVVGVAYKDRAAIMPAGHTGDAYWVDKESGNWITSTYYTDDLPKWARDFNAAKHAEKFVSQKWELLFPESEYMESEGDNQPYEETFGENEKPVFPYVLNMESLPNSPFVNTYTKDFAIAAIEGENLGGGDETDFLTISFSGTDYAGHWSGPQSKELQDVYLRLDRDLDHLFSYLDDRLGKGNYTVFLTADHAVAEVPGYAKKHRLPGGIWLESKIYQEAKELVAETYGKANLFKDYVNYQFYLDKEEMAKKGITVDELTALFREKLTLLPGVYSFVNLEDGKMDHIPTFFQEKLNTMYNPKRSGEIILLPEPGWMDIWSDKGTTHGTMYSYDTHTPLLFYGWGINKGQTFETTYISDIAPTLAMLLKILEPSGNIGKPIGEALKK